MIENLLFIANPFVSYSSWNKRILVAQITFKHSQKILLDNKIIELFNIFMKKYCLFLLNFNKSLSFK